MTASVILLLIALVVLALVWQAVGILGNRPASLVRVSEKAVNQLVLAGTGINLTGMPSTNLVSGGSFSPLTRHAHYFANDGEPAAFRIKMTEARSRVPLAKDYYTGASFSLFRESLSEMTLINTGRITAYEAGIVSGKRQVSLPPEMVNPRWSDFAESDGTVYACGAAGTLVKLPRDGLPEQMAFRFDVNLTALAAGPGGLLAGDSDGKLYASSDGANWSLITQGRAGFPVRAIEYIDLPDEANGFYLASGGPGELFFGHPSGLEKLSFPMDDRITALIKAGDGIVYALGDSGNVASSSNGVQWQLEESLKAREGWLAGKAGGGVTFFAGRGGQMAVKADKGAVEFLDAGDSMDSRMDLTEIMVMSSGRFVVLATDGRMLHSKDGGKTWKLENPFDESRIERFELFPAGDIFLAKTDGTIIQAELTAQIRFEPALESGSVISGDLMTVRLSESPELDTHKVDYVLRDEVLPAGEWAISGGASFLTEADAREGREGYDSGGACALTYEKPELDLPAGQEGQAGMPPREILFSVRRGTSIMAPVSNPDRPYLNARLTQKLDLTRLVIDDSLPFYRLEFDARVTGRIDGPIEVWFSGSLPAVGESVRIQGEAWQHRRFTLLFPRGLRLDDEVWINFGFAGSGTLYLDNVWFGRNDDTPGALSGFMTREATGLADVIRLDAVPIGRHGYEEESWCLPEGTGSAGGDDCCFHNLGAALQFVEAQGASPWLVVDLHATSAELAHLVEYLAGPPLSAYGKIRSRDGAIGRWTDTFNLIYVELADEAGILPNDASRANYVHWIMDQIKSAPDFQGIRNQVFFIDSMQYDDGRSHTSADFHAGDLRLSRPLESEEAVEAALNDWINSMPRRGMSGGVPVPELARSVLFDFQDQPVRLVDAAGAVLADLGDHTALVLMNLDYTEGAFLSRKNVSWQALQAFRGLSGLQKLEEPALIRSSGAAGDPAEDPDIEAGDQDDRRVLFYAFGSRDTTLVFALNLDRSAHVVSIQGMDRQGSTFKLCDHRGKTISQGSWGRKHDEFTLLPGGVLVIQETKGGAG
ncbi:MAG TPA: hypothetical protein PK646_00760 [Bacillota bacterium]|jgi:hypothetical protein|nr:hypothetical protein [Fastidiosipila sp.]HPX92715.1 hypothetical protein [Bacillota bacterium]HQB80612.1 hypothetical protein [Bacillota bacterium]